MQRSMKLVLRGFSREDVRRRFVFNVSRDLFRSGERTAHLDGQRRYHPTPTSEEIARLAPNAQLIRGWKTPGSIPTTIERVRQFLRSEHTAELR